jgi:histone deacetylase 1/2
LSVPPSISSAGESSAAEASSVPTNTHSMIIRAKAGVLKPKTYVAGTLGPYCPTIEPHTVKEALSKPKWLQAMQHEYDALLKNNTWTLVDPPSRCKLIGCKWIFKTKYNADGTFQRHKARLVAKGFHQRAALDFNETLSSVIKPTTVRVILTLALSK